ncbi:translocation/assembly module TamB domain-containing protein [Microcoleus sp. FACHB-53]|nr:translocation/assembly module TamB domain-containing protein [Microcoleus sp. FACHB-53]
MTNAPNPGNEPEPTSENPPEQPSTSVQRRRHWQRLAIVLSLILLSGIGGGLTWVWFFVYRQLAPQVETTVSKLINRPVNLGRVEGFSPTGLRFGASSLPATATDSDRATAEAVEVSFKLLPLLTNRTLPLDITLVKPKVYLEQAQDGRWFDLDLQTLPKGQLDIKLNVLRVRDADVVLVPRGASGNSKKPIPLSLSSGKALFLNNNKLIKFDTGGQLAAGGNLTISGNTIPATGEINAAILGNDLSAPEVGRLIQLPLILQAGAINGNLEVKSIPKKPLTFLGTAGLKNVTAQLDPLPQSFANTTGQLRFKGTQIRLEKVNTLFGQIPAQANGTIDTQAGFNLSAQTQAIQLPQALRTFNIKTLPVLASAQLKADLQVTGTPNKPVVSGKFTTTNVAQIDKVKFRVIASDFGVVGSTLSVSNLRALPSLGGLVTGNGQVQLGSKGGGVTFNFQGNNLPGDAIALTYDFKPPVPLGLISGRTQVVGSLNDADNVRATGSANLKIAEGFVAVRDIQATQKRFTAQVQASDLQVGRLAEVPPQFRVPVSGNLRISGPLTNITAATIQGSGSGSLNLAGGKVRATNIQLANGRFTAQVQASDLQVGRLAEVPPQFRAPVSGNFTLSGPLTEFSTAKIQGSGTGSLNLAGGTVRATNVQLAEGRFTAQVQASGVEVQRLATVPPQLRGPVSGNFNLSGPLTELSMATIQGTGTGRLNVAGGTIRATNLQLAEGRFTAQVQASGVEVQRLAKVPPQIRGPLSGTFNLAGDLANLSPATLQGSGSGSLNIAGGTLRATNVQLANGNFTAQVQASGVPVERLGNVPPQVRGPLSGTFNLAGNVANLSPATLQASGSGSLNIGGGTLRATNVQLANGNFTAQVQASGVPVERLGNVPPQVRGSLSGTFNLAGNVANLSPATLQGSGSGSLNVAGGTIRASNIQLANGNFTAQVQASGVQVERLAQVPPQFRGALTGDFNLAGSLNNLSPSTIQGSGSGRLNVAEGTINASNVQLREGRFQANVEAADVPLASFSPDLRGRLNGQLDVSGSLAALSPNAIQARGQVNFSEGIALIDRSLTAVIDWNGQQQQLQIQQATAEGFQANGVVNVNLANQGLQAIQGFDLNVQANNLNLKQLSANFPTATNVAGQADFNGRIAGSVTAPNVNGTIALRDFAVEGLAFESPLTGSVNTAAGQGLNLNLAGANDRIAVALGSDYQPVSFDIKRGETIAQGQRQGDVLQVSTQKFPIALLKEFTPVPPAIATQPLKGDISGSLDVNLKTFEVSLNNIAITGPIFNARRSDSSQPLDNEYLLSGKISRTAAGPQFQNVKLTVKQGELPVVVAALQAFQLINVTPANLSFNSQGGTLVTPILLDDVPLQTQLRRLSEIKALEEQQREQREASSVLPDIAELQGRFTGSVTVDGSLATGISTQINIEGQDWKWDTYNISQVSVLGEGRFENGVLSLLPLRIQSGNSLISYSGTIGGEAQSGQLQLQNIPIDQLQTVLSKVPNVPPNLVGFTGLLNATATLSGSIKNPQARGVITLADATLNQTNVQRALSTFSYNDARLNFNSELLLAESENPLSIGGSIPFMLPVATVAPASDKLNLNINVQNDGIALLNLFTGGQVSWVDGTGAVQVEVSGILNQQTNRPEQLVAQGSANIENATIQASALPDPLTNVKGKVGFNFNTIEIVETLTGQYSGGSVTAVGALPISQGGSQDQRIAIDIGELGLNLKGLYRGRVQGNVAIAGTALNPKIGGEVTLFNGDVSLAEQTAATGGGGGGGGGGIGGDSTSSNRVEFDNLRLKLDRNVQITKAPILNFLADGTLTLNGSLGNIEPEGTIDIKRGQVNLFTTQFRLARGYENTAQFTRKQGLDPILNVRLVASVSEGTQRRLASDPLSAEINDAPSLTGVGSLQTVRIQAKVEGPASQLTDNLELTSSPSRNKSEIVALLGGSFVDTLGRGDTTLGLVNLAGSALLGNVQNIIGDALGLSEFRLSPTIITNEKRRSSALGLNAEAGVDIGRNLSVSVSKELTTDQAAQFGLRYRVNEKTLLRGSTDFSGDSRAVVEYETRF